MIVPPATRERWQAGDQEPSASRTVRRSTDTPTDRHRHCYTSFLPESRVPRRSPAPPGPSPHQPDSPLSNPNTTPTRYRACRTIPRHSRDTPPPPTSCPETSPSLLCRKENGRCSSPYPRSTRFQNETALLFPRDRHTPIAPPWATKTGSPMVPT